MPDSCTRCIHCVATQGCRYCSGRLIKHGKTSGQKARFLCKKCGKTQLDSYSSAAYALGVDEQIIALIKEGVGIRGIGRLLAISPTTVIRHILKIAAQIKPPPLSYGQHYEVDELCTYIQKKSRTVWVVSAYCREQKQVVRFHVGRRNSNTLAWVLKSLRLSKAKAIYTDGYRLYRYLIPKSLHRSRRFTTNRIERWHLNLRTHLKRLHRRSIAFSRNKQMLLAHLTIYNFG